MNDTHRNQPPANGADRPITVLIGAMGGEGGGVLMNWIVTAAVAQGLPVQATSVPGVAQRTGATTYYIEILPVALDTLDGREPVLSLYPSLGDVDLVVASELVEVGRTIERGFVSPDRTTLIGSTHRHYSIGERTAGADGRYDTTRILGAAETMAKRAILFDGLSVARDSGSVLNAVLLGTIAGSGASSGGTVIHPGYSPVWDSFHLTGLYDPKAFIAHAPSLRQGFPHCAIFLTAASRRSLGRVSVPVWLAVLSDQLPIIALVGRYPANKLMGRGPIPKRQLLREATIWPQGPRPPWSYGVLAPLSRCYPPLRGRLPTRYSPVRRFTHPVAGTFSLDLHVLGTAPAFALSQDQTLQFN